MHDMTAANLRSAYGGESMAHMRYLVWAGKAAEDGFPNVGRLFRAIAAAEQIHATNHFKVMGDVDGAHLVAGGGEFGYGETGENLVGGINGEDFEIREMYPAYLETAKYQKEGLASKTFFYALEAEKTHLDLFRSAKEAVDAGKDLDIGPVHVCQVCGYTHVGAEPPEKCPVCAHAADEFTAFA